MFSKQMATPLEDQGFLVLLAPLHPFLVSKGTVETYKKIKQPYT